MLNGFAKSGVWFLAACTSSAVLAQTSAAPAASPPTESTPEPQPLPDQPAVAQPSTVARLPSGSATPTAETFKRLDDLQLKGWDITFPRVEDSILGDNKVREALADKGIGLFFAFNNGFQYDFLQNDHGYKGPQIYNGQNVTRTITAFNIYATYDLDEIGLKGGQISSSFSILGNSFRKINGPHFARVSRLNYYQELFDDSVEFKVGIMENSFEFFGSSVGGSYATGNLGPLASIPYQIGVSYGGVGAPGANIRFNFRNHFYDKIGIQRSLTPGGATAEVKANPSGFRFAPRGTGVVVIDEAGYHRPSADGEKSLWVRGGGIFNSTQFHAYDGSGTRSNRAMFLAVDAQLTQPDARKPFRGYYAGFTYNGAPSKQNLVDRYYEARVYGQGVVQGRPSDLASIVASMTSYSATAERALAKPGAGFFGKTYSVIGSYAYRLSPGLYFQPGLGVTVHPIYSPKFGTALNGYFNITALF